MIRQETVLKLLVVLVLLVLLLLLLLMVTFLLRVVVVVAETEVVSIGKDSSAHVLFAQSNSSMVQSNISMDACQIVVWSRVK